MAETEVAEPQEEARTIAPIPPGSLPGVTPHEQQDHQEPEQEVEGEFEFAGRKWKTRAQAEAAFASMRGRENPKDQRIRELESEISRRDAQLDLLSRNKDRAEDARPSTREEKKELTNFLSTLKPETIERFNELLEQKGEAYAFSWLLQNFEEFQGGRIAELEKTINELKRTAIDEPAEVQKESEEWANTVYALATRAQQLAEEGEGIHSAAFAEVFPPGEDEDVHAKNFDEVHQIMLDPNPSDSPEGLYKATLAWIGYQYLLEKQGGSKQKGRRQAKEETPVDPTVPSTRAGSRPRTSASEPSFLGPASRSGPLGKL